MSTEKAAAKWRVTYKAHWWSIRYRLLGVYDSKVEAIAAITANLVRGHDALVWNIRLESVSTEPPRIRYRGR